MAQRIVVTGTDTGIGKTVFAAGLTALLGACYWKPVQAGLAEETDACCVQRLAGLSDDRVISEAFPLADAAPPPPPRPSRSAAAGAPSRSRG